MDSNLTLSVAWETPHGNITATTGKHTLSGTQTGISTYTHTLTIFLLSVGGGGGGGGDGGRYRCYVSATPFPSSEYLLPTAMATPSNTVELTVTGRYLHILLGECVGMFVDYK